MNRPESSITVVSVTGRIRAYFELTKPRIATLLLIVALAAFGIASRGALDWWGIVKVFVSVGSLAAGIFALNHYIERDKDALMLRTRERPLPSARLAPPQALRFGIILTTFSFLFCAVAVNLLSSLIAIFVAVSYLLLYTPLKYRTPYHTSIGALSGAAPPLMGWATATGGLDINAWILFAVLYFWQFPHFLSIDMIYKDDYRKAGIRVLPVADPTGLRVAFQVCVSLALLLVVSMLPLMTGLARLPYAISALVMGIFFLAIGIRAVITKEKMHAKHLLRTSVLYLPLLFIMLIVNP